MLLCKNELWKLLYIDMLYFVNKDGNWICDSWVCLEIWGLYEYKISGIFNK